MEKYKCKLCPKFFNNGKALGGHMRSHLAKLPICPSKEKQKEESSLSISDTDSESYGNAARSRPKRVKPTHTRSTTELDPVSSVSDTSAEEDVALSLMMLSNDTWHWVDPVKHVCEVCDKVFKSSQALGGHKTSHKKKKKCEPVDDVAESTRSVTRVKKTVKGKLHECPICYKVFGSGQALGGHKRSHFVISPLTGANFGEDLVNDKIIKFGDNWIDLNMPAPIEDGDEMSAISVIEVINYG